MQNQSTQQFWWEGKVQLKFNNWQEYSSEQKQNLIIEKIENQRLTHMESRTFIYPPILHILSKIQLNFSKLISISLQNCLIQSIQLICRISAFNLKELSLKNNKIHTISALRKCYWNDLKWLILNNNPIVDASLVLPSIRTCEEIQCIGIDSQIVNQGFLMKLQANTLYCYTHIKCFEEKEEDNKFLDRYQLKAKNPGSYCVNYIKTQAN